MAEFLSFLLGQGPQMLTSAMTILNVINKAQQALDEIGKTAQSEAKRKIERIEIKPVMIIDNSDKGDRKKIGLIIEGIEDDVETAVEVLARGFGIHFEKLVVRR